MPMSEESKTEFTGIRKCLNKKISWTMSGVVVAISTVIAFLVYEAYSGEQKRQCEEIKQNTTRLEEVRSAAKVMAVRFEYVKEQLEDLKEIQKTQFRVIVEKLGEIKKKGGDRE